MSINIKATTILDNTQTTPINRVTAVLGMNVKQLNVRVELDPRSIGAATIPSQIPIEIRVLEPKLRRPTMSSLPNPFSATVVRQGTSNTFFVSLDPAKLNPLMKPASGFKKVATVVRDGGTSAAKFRAELAHGGWALRGAAKQPGEGKPDVTGNVLDEQPDARTLFMAGGVEVLEVSIPASAGFRVGPNTKSWIFLRSPANVFFYSGHGAWWDCSLLLEEASEYDTWLNPEDLIPVWSERGPDYLRSPQFNLDVLIINGCSVLANLGKSIQGTRGTASDWNAKGTAHSCARRWGKLLETNGPLVAILGYRDTAPLDSGGGDQIAVEMAQAMVKGLADQWDKYAHKWVEINARHSMTRTAAATDVQGYYFVNQKMAPGSHTHDAREMPGYDKNKPENAVIGPGPIPHA